MLKQEGSRIDKYSDEEIRAIKLRIIDLFDKGQVKTISQACDILEVSKVRIYNWLKNDPEWSASLKQAKEVLADRLEEDLFGSSNDVAKFFLLKGLRPEMYRDNYKVVVSNPVIEQHLKKLEELGKQPEVKELSQGSEASTLIPLVSSEERESKPIQKKTLT